MSSPWDTFASLRRSQIESGKDLTFSRVFVPLFKELIGTLQPASILEVGVGTGHLALELQELSVRYVGVEPSNGMFREASDVLRNNNVEIFNSTLEDLDTGLTFELVLAHMCLQTIEDHAAFLRSLRSHLVPGGTYLLSIPHPAFFNDYKKVISEEVYCYSQECSGVISFSVTLDPKHPICNVPYFHRPLSIYMSALRSAGLTLTNFHEVFPPIDVQLLYGAPWKTPRYLLLAGTTSEPASDRQGPADGGV